MRERVFCIVNGKLIGDSVNMGWSNKDWDFLRINLKDDVFAF